MSVLKATESLWGFALAPVPRLQSVSEPAGARGCRRPFSTQRPWVRLSQGSAIVPWEVRSEAAPVPWASERLIL